MVSERMNFQLNRLYFTDGYFRKIKSGNFAAFRKRVFISLK